MNIITITNMQIMLKNIMMKLIIKAPLNIILMIIRRNSMMLKNILRYSWIIMPSKMGVTLTNLIIIKLTSIMGATPIFSLTNHPRHTTIRMRQPPRLIKHFIKMTGLRMTLTLTNLNQRRITTTPIFMNMNIFTSIHPCAHHLSKKLN